MAKLLPFLFSALLSSSPEEISSAKPLRCWSLDPFLLFLFPSALLLKSILGIVMRNSGSFFFPSEKMFMQSAYLIRLQYFIARIICKATADQSFK